MILVFLRIVLGAGLLYSIGQAYENAREAPQSGDLTNAFWLAVALVLALANAAAWAPFLGARISEPLTGILTEGTCGERKNHLLGLAHWLEARRWRRPTLWVCFLEGVHHPELPAAFVLGLRNSRQGSWLEKVFAREVFRFDNAQHCVEAFHALRRHRIDPRPHPNAAVNQVLISLERQARPEPPIVPLPSAELPAPVQRHPDIQLFEGADDFASGMETGLGPGARREPPS